MNTRRERWSASGQRASRVGGMEGPMHPMDHQRLTFTDDVQHALDPEQPVTPGGAHCHQPAIEEIPVERFLESQAERSDMLVVPRTVVMVVCVTVMVVA